MKNLIFVILLILFIIFIAFIFSLFFQTEEKLRYEECVLLQNPETQKVDCFGCFNDICKDAPTDFILYEKPEIGIPYTCYESKQGCQLAQ